MGQHPQYGQLAISDIAAAAKLAVFAHILRGHQAMGSATAAAHAIEITFDPRASGVEFPAAHQDPSRPSVTIVLQHQYWDLFVDWRGVAVTLSFRGQLHRIEIPYAAITNIADTHAGLLLEVPVSRASSDFQEAFGFALATLMVFQWGSEAAPSELEGRAMFALLPAIVSRIAKGSSKDAASATVIFDTNIIGVALPPAITAVRQDLMSFTLTPGDRDIRVRSDKFIIECEGVEGENYMLVPFVAVQKISIPSQSLALNFFPGPVADPFADPKDPSRQDAPGKGLDLLEFGSVTPPSRFPPGSMVQLCWETGQFCLTSYVGQYTVPGLNFPQEVRDRVPLGPTTSAEILVFDEPRHNAVAFKRGSRYCVGVYHGLIETIPMLALALWSRPDVAPWIGDVSRLPAVGPSAEIPEGLELLRGDAAYCREDGARIGTSRLQPEAAARAPQNQHRIAAMDPVRRMAFQQCVEDAFRHMWLHEIGHVVWGHVDLVQDSSGALGMSEVDNACGDTHPPELGQFMEFQTDKFAFGRVLSYRTSALENAARSQQIGDPGRGMPDFVDQATIAIMGCLIPQLVFAVNLQIQGRDDVARTHPPIWLRVADMISEARSAASSLDLGQDRAAAERMDGLLTANMNRAVGSIIATHPMLAQVFQPLHDEEDARFAFGQAFEASIPRWDQIVRPHFKFHRGENGKIALRD